MADSVPADMTRSVFLSADWRYLAILNYPIDPGVLLPLVPAGTELDSWNGQTYVSMVGFLFLNTRVLGVPIPFHRNFEEVNLRFYVRREVAGELRRAVVFVRELVPRRAIAWTANAVYGEKYIAVPMAHAIEHDSAGQPARVEYSWRYAGREHRIALAASGSSAEPDAGSAEEFITEHYWGYARQRDGGVIEYRVEHPRWRVWAAADARLDCDVTQLYGDRFLSAVRGDPVSAFLADGSAVTVSRGFRIQ